MENCKEQYYPNIADNLLAPIALIELSVCGCKTGYKTNHCKCRKSGFTCTNMYKCAQTENNDYWIEDKDKNIWRRYLKKLMRISSQGSN